MSIHADKIASLAGALKTFQATLDPGQRITGVHLFGIDFGKELAEMTVEHCKDIAEKSGLKRSLGTELHKGVRLSKFVKRR